jgi:tRNA(Arg) A34 adenosine deaminase TadA
MIGGIRHSQKGYWNSSKIEFRINFPTHDIWNIIMCNANKPEIHFPKPEHDYDQLELMLNAYEANPKGYPHDEGSIISIREGIRAGRNGSVAVGGCLYHHDKLIAQNQTKANAPYHRLDLHAEMVLLNDLEEQLCDNKTPRMRDYTLFTSQEPCPMCLARICFSQVGTTYYVYRDEHSPEAGEQTNFERLPEGFQILGSRLKIKEADCAPELKEIAKQVWQNSIDDCVNEWFDRY